MVFPKTITTNTTQLYSFPSYSPLVRSSSCTTNKCETRLNTNIVMGYFSGKVLSETKFDATPLDQPKVKSQEECVKLCVKKAACVTVLVGKKKGIHSCVLFSDDIYTKYYLLTKMRPSYTVIVLGVSVLSLHAFFIRKLENTPSSRLS